MDIFHAIYNVPLSNKHENILQDMCWSDVYLIIDLGDKWLDNYKNSVTEISSVAMCIGMVDRHTFFHDHKRCCLISTTTMRHHRVFICLKDTIVHLTRPSVLCIADFIFEFLDNDNTTILKTNVKLWNICNNHNHTLTCIVHTSYPFGVEECYVE